MFVKDEELKEEENKNSKPKSSEKNKVKKTISLSIGGKIFHLVEGENLPEEINKKFFRSLKNDKII